MGKKKFVFILPKNNQSTTAINKFCEIIKKSFKLIQIKILLKN